MKPLWSAPAKEIRFKISPGTYTENLHIFAPVSAHALTLNGTGSHQTIVDGNQQDCVVQIDKGYSATIRNITLTNGKCLPAGGILNDGSLTLIKVTVSQNEGEETAGGIATTSTAG